MYVNAVCTRARDTPGILNNACVISSAWSNVRVRLCKMEIEKKNDKMLS